MVGPILRDIETTRGKTNYSLLRTGDSDESIPTPRHRPARTGWSISSLARIRALFDGFVKAMAII